MHADGMALREIEREFGIDRKDIGEWIRRYERDGIDGLGRQKYSRTTYEQRCEAVRDFIERGLTYRELVDKYEVSRGQLKVWVSKVRASGYESLVARRRGRPSKAAVMQEA